MLTFDRIKRFYDQGYWTKQQVADAVVYGQITPAEYESITGEPYQNVV